MAWWLGASGCVAQSPVLELEVALALADAQEAAGLALFQHLENAGGDRSMTFRARGAL